MNLHEVKNLIKALPCFNTFGESESVIGSPLSIFSINEGQSSVCYKVCIGSATFFVKHLKENVGVNAECVATNKASLHLFAPKVIFSNDNWLVSEFIEGTTLFKSVLSSKEKMMVALKLMKKCHHTPITLPVFDIVDTLENYIKLSSFSTVQKDILFSVISDLGTEPTQNLVFCHGDLNYTNIIYSTVNWLVDFECACLAEAEFDIAMFMAINVLNKTERDIAIACYNQDLLTLLNQDKIDRYLAYSYLLNGLWYINKFEEMDLVNIKSGEFSVLRQLAEQQFRLLAAVSSVDINWLKQ